MSKSDFIRTAAVSPALKVANTSYNTDRIIACAREAADNGAAVILFRNWRFHPIPAEICSSSSTCTKEI